MKLTSDQFKLVIEALSVKQTAEEQGLTLEQLAERYHPGDPLNFFRVREQARGIILAEEWLRPPRPELPDDHRSVRLWDHLEALILSTELVMLTPTTTNRHQQLLREMQDTQQELAQFVEDMKGGKVA